MPEANLPRSIAIIMADYGVVLVDSGEVIWPEFCLNAYNKSVISGLDLHGLETSDSTKDCKAIRMSETGNTCSERLHQRTH
jgi:hypothetical protein